MHTVTINQATASGELERLSLCLPIIIVIYTASEVKIRYFEYNHLWMPEEWLFWFYLAFYIILLSFQTLSPWSHIKDTTNKSASKFNELYLSQPRWYKEKIQAAWNEMAKQKIPKNISVKFPLEKHLVMHPT